MKLFPIILSFLLVNLYSCRPGHDHPHPHDKPEKFSSLTLEQVEKLLPYMTELKADGQMVMKMDSVRSKDGHVLNRHTNSQVYSFSLVVDENDKPVMPTDSVAMRRQGGGRTGGFSIMCMGGCLGTAGGFPCIMTGCAPIENSCGCTPLQCGVCETLDCSSSVIGWMSGGVVMM